MTTLYKFKKSILVVVLYMGICVMIEAKLPDFDCDTTGNIILKNNTDVSHTEIIKANGDLCIPKSKQLSSECAGTSGKSIKIVYGPTAIGDQLVGGKDAEYGILSCEDSKFVATAAAKLLVVSVPSTIPTKANPIPYTISLSITGQKTGLLGEHLKLSLEGPDAKHFLQPIECTAKATGALDEDKLKIWELHNGGDFCHNEPSVIEDKWKTVISSGLHNRKLNIDMYAFRFATSSSVTIECSAFVCPTETSGDCTKKCIDNTRRRRGAIHGIQTSPKSNNTSTKIMVASTSFQVQLGDQNTGNSAARLSKNVQLYSVASIFVLMVTMMI